MLWKIANQTLSVKRRNCKHVFAEMSDFHVFLTRITRQWQTYDIITSDQQFLIISEGSKNNLVFKIIYFFYSLEMEQLLNYRQEVIELINDYTSRKNQLIHNLAECNAERFLNTDEEEIYRRRCLFELQKIDELIESNQKDLSEIEELIKNPPAPTKTKEKIKKVIKTFDEEIEDHISFRSRDSWKSFNETIIDGIDECYKSTIKSVIREYRGVFDKALSALITFIRRNIQKDRSITVNKNIINSTFNRYDKYVDRIAYKSMLKADPAEDNSESVKVCVRKTMKYFNETFDVDEVINDRMNEMMNDGFKVQKEVKWIDTIEKDQWYDINDLVESYNDFHNTAITSIGFGKLKEIKENFTKKQLKMKGRKFTAYQRI